MYRYSSRNLVEFGNVSRTANQHDQVHAIDLTRRGVHLGNKYWTLRFIVKASRGPDHMTPGDTGGPI